MDDNQLIMAMRCCIGTAKERCKGCPMGVGVGCAQRLSDMLEDRISELSERLAIITEGRHFIDGDELLYQLLLLSATAGGKSGPEMTDLCIEQVKRMVKRGV